MITLKPLKLPLNQEINGAILGWLGVPLKHLRMCNKANNYTSQGAIPGFEFVWMA